MQAEEIRALLQSNIENSQAEVNVDGSHVHVDVTSESFRGLSAVKKQQLVYSVLNDLIASGEIHALHIKTHLP